MKSVLICKHWNSLISNPNFAKMLFTYTPTSTLIGHSESTTFHLLEYDLIQWHESRRSNKPFCCSVYNALKPNLSRSRKINKLDPKFKVLLPHPESVMIIRRTRVYFKAMNSCNRDTYLQPNNSQYKVMRIQINKHSKDHHDDGMIVEMHIVGTSTWINIEVDYPKNLTFLSWYSTYLNGALHWIGSDAHDNASIWCFNFDTERFQSFSMPEMDTRTKFSLFEFRDSLCVMYYTDNLVTMWMMEKYGIGESWVRIFHISVCSGSDHQFFHPPDTNSDIIASRSHSCIVYLDRDNQEFKIFEAPWFDFTFEAIRHVPSLISLKDVIIGDNVEVLNIYSLDGSDRGF
ncbi:hypothetical protein PIB30_044940 [Stylosanthes scabra]|uniref:F-box associated beta-propeller type 1 domain-containing protein n=1 Tax=Stylosanthes scabra TaxID=79078 RepID=A0ABU6QFQ5_9FABA|nr:hypothetical protein [Stylosanthes scabra]